MIYPWQAEAWQQFLQYLITDRLPHAILLTGPSAIGKIEFCLAYMQRMNCMCPTQDDYACGVCVNCRLFKAGTHPDVRMLNIDKDQDQPTAEQIKVDDIRDVNQFVSLSRQQARYKLVCMNHAHLMNTNAANALLKTLEEPPADSILFLVSHRAENLLATIKSRCQIWKFCLPNKEQALQWLQQQENNSTWDTILSVSGYRPLLALDLHQTGLGEARARFYDHLSQLMRGTGKVTTISTSLQNETLEQLVAWQQGWCADLIRCHYAKQPVTLENPDIHRSLHSLVGRVDLGLLFDFLHKLAELHRLSNAPLNRRLFIEDMLIRCRDTLKQPCH